MAKWTTDSIPELHGKTVVVTGANTGLGLESARALADKGAEVVMACRSLDKAEGAADRLRADLPDARLHVMSLDLQDLSSVRAFAQDFAGQFGRLDILLNNAGVMNTPYGVTRDGFETQMGTNHLGHFALTGLLLPSLRATPRSRVVTVTSSGHRVGQMDFTDFMFEDGHGYLPLRAYGRSKLANLLFAYELQRLFDRHHIDSLSLAAHPGASQTELGRHIEGALVFRVLNPLLTRLVQSPAMGALPQLRACCDPTVCGGDYYGPEGLGEMGGHPVRVRSSRASRSRTDAARLWQRSERLTGVLFDFGPQPDAATASAPAK